MVLNFSKNVILVEFAVLRINCFKTYCLKICFILVLAVVLCQLCSRAEA